MSRTRRSTGQAHGVRHEEPSIALRGQPRHVCHRKRSLGRCMLFSVLIRRANGLIKAVRSSLPKGLNSRLTQPLDPAGYYRAIADQPAHPDPGAYGGIDHKLIACRGSFAEYGREHTRRRCRQWASPRTRCGRSSKSRRSGVRLKPPSARRRTATGRLYPDDDAPAPPRPRRSRAQGSSDERAVHADPPGEKVLKLRFGQRTAAPAR